MEIRRLHKERGISAENPAPAPPFPLKVIFMEENSIFQKIRDWIRRILRALFTEDVLALIGQAARGEHMEEDTADTEDAPLLKENTAPERAYGTDMRKDDGGGLPAGQTDREKGQRTAGSRERRHMVFFGRVQGVGFRYHLMYDARNHGLTGWVENLPDGSVEAELQGSPEAIDFVVHNLGNGRWIRIEGMESRQVPVVESERGFQVRGY